MSATILKFPDRKAQLEEEAAAAVGYGQGEAARRSAPVSEYDCNFLDAIRNCADRSLDVTRLEKTMLESFLHDELKLGAEFAFGSRRYRLTFQVEDLTPPKSFA